MPFTIVFLQIYFSRKCFLPHLLRSMLNFELVGICPLNTWRLNFDKVESPFHKDNSYQIQLHSGALIMFCFQF